MKKYLLISSIAITILSFSNTLQASDQAEATLTASVAQTAEISGVNDVTVPNFAANEIGTPGVSKTVENNNIKLFDNNAAGGISITTNSQHTNSNGSILQHSDSTNSPLQVVATLTPCGAGATPKQITTNSSTTAKTTNFSSAETSATSASCDTNPAKISYDVSTTDASQHSGTYTGKLTYTVTAA